MADTSSAKTLRSLGFAIGTALQDGKYVIQSPPIETGFNLVYRATHSGTQQSVRLKMLHPRLCDRADFKSLQQQCMAQIKRLAQCNHPHLVRILDSFRLENLDCWVVDDSPGVSLQDLVQTQGTLSEKLAVHYVNQIGRALTELHHNGLIHGNIQPQHIRRLAGTEAVILTDAGLVGTALANLGAAHPEQLGSGYAAIEQYHAPVKRQATTDVYGLAATLYYLLTGHAPTASPLREQIPLSSPKALNNELSDTVEQAILGGMALMMDQRPPAIADWLKRLPAPKAIDLPQPTQSARSAASAAAVTVTASAPGAFVSQPTVVPPTHQPAAYRVDAPQKSKSSLPKLIQPKSAQSKSAQSKSAQPKSTTAQSKVKQAQTTRRRWPIALGITALIAATTGAGLGLALRLQQTTDSDLGIGLGRDQTFPPTDHWPGSANDDPELFFEDPAGNINVQPGLQPNQTDADRADPPPVIEAVPEATEPRESPVHSSSGYDPASPPPGQTEPAAAPSSATPSNRWGADAPEPPSARQPFVEPYEPPSEPASVAEPVPPQPESASRSGPNSSSEPTQAAPNISKPAEKDVPLINPAAPEPPPPAISPAEDASTAN